MLIYILFDVNIAISILFQMRGGAIPVELNGVLKPLQADVVLIQYVLLDHLVLFIQLVLYPIFLILKFG